MTGAPWGPWLRRAVLELGLTPEQFWRLSLWEWRALNAAAQAMTGADAARLKTEMTALLSDYPDKGAPFAKDLSDDTFQ